MNRTIRAGLLVAGFASLAVPAIYARTQGPVQRDIDPGHAVQFVVSAQPALAPLQLALDGTQPPVPPKRPMALDGTQPPVPPKRVLALDGTQPPVPPKRALALDGTQPPVPPKKVLALDGTQPPVPPKRPA
jgi:hypothetical protein